MRQDTTNQLVRACSLVRDYSDALTELDWPAVYSEVQRALRMVDRDAAAESGEILIADPTVAISDRPRLGRLALQILTRLRLRGRQGVTSTELTTMSHRFGARLHDIRRAGHIITSHAVGDGVFRYIYLRGPEGPPPPLVIFRRTNG